MMTSTLTQKSIMRKKKSQKKHSKSTRRFMMNQSKQRTLTSSLILPKSMHCMRNSKTSKMSSISRTTTVKKTRKTKKKRTKSTTAMRTTKIRLNPLRFVRNTAKKSVRASMKSTVRKLMLLIVALNSKQLKPMNQFKLLLSQSRLKKKSKKQYPQSLSIALTQIYSSTLLENNRRVIQLKMNLNLFKSRKKILLRQCL